MSLAARMVADWFPEHRVDVGLLADGKELKGAGYARAQGPTWTVRDAQASSSTLFGPFTRAVSFDSVGVFVDGELVEVIPYAGSVSLPAGVPWEASTVTGFDG